MKKILIFGASGLVGTALTSIARAHGHEVLTPQHSEVDLLDIESLESYILRAHADVVVNAAALISIDSLEKDPLPAWQINAVAAGAIARAAARCPETTLIYLSTQLVFDGRKSFYSEDDLLSPVNIYGTTKAAGEVLVRQYASVGKMPHYIVRTALVYGVKRATFVDEVARVLREGQVFEAATDQYSNPTNADDLAEAIYAHFIKQKREQESGVYHLINRTQEGGVSRYEIAQKIAQIIGVSPSLVMPAQSGAVFATKRPNVTLLNTRLPALPEWDEALRRHFSRK